jgi:hypothetical protein
LIEALAVVEHIHIRSHLADMVEHRIVEVVQRKGSVEGEHHKDFEEYHILNVGLLHLRVVPVLHKDSVEH